MLIVIVVVLVALGLAAGFVAAVRLSKQAQQRSAAHPRAGLRTSESANAEHLDRLEIGARITYDRQNWVVVGRQRVAPQAGADWTAWHLESDGQPGWLATYDADPAHVVFAVGAERPETVDPRVAPLRWRDVEWRRIDGEEGAPAVPVPTEPEGERQRLRQPREALDGRHLESIAFTRDELPRRRLVLERQTGDHRWAVWIGDQVSASMLDVYAPVILPPTAG